MKLTLSYWQNKSLAIKTQLIGLNSSVMIANTWRMRKQDKIAKMSFLSMDTDKWWQQPLQLCFCIICDITKQVKNAEGSKAKMEDVKKLNFNLLTLGGGISLGSITELAGQSGLGKTQACIQWSLSVQLPAQFGGVEGRCVYLDCDGNFCPERASEMASSLMRSHSRLAQDTEERFDLPTMFPND